jgi:glucose-1-phosphate cytidylyltransferase
MKVVLFCGGQGMRMREYSESIPKPMVPLGYRPVMWHLMRYYAHYGHNDFIVCLGYRGDAIKEYFLNYEEWQSNDFILSGSGNEVELLNRDTDDWRITFVDTGLQANIGERLRAIKPFLEGEDVFLANYADGLTDSPVPDQIDHFHRQGRIASFLCVRPHHSFHVVSFNEDDTIDGVTEAGAAGIWVNGGFFVLSTRIFDYLEPGEELVYEPFQRLIKLGELTALRHDGFWAGMDTFKDRQELDALYERGEAPWAVWETR